MLKIEDHLLHEIVDSLRRSTGLIVELRGPGGEDEPFDDVLQIATSTEQPLLLPIDVKATVDRRDQILGFKQRHAPDVVLGTGQLSAELAQYCRENNVMFADAAGNCFLKDEKLLVFILGQKGEAQNISFKDPTVTPATLRVMLAILTRPQLLNEPVREIGEAAGISHGAAGKALETLRELGFHAATRSRRRVLSRPERWLDVWTEGYLARIRPKLHKRRMRPPSMEYALRHVSPALYEVELGGTAGAHLQLFSKQPHQAAPGAETPIAIGSEAAASKLGYSIAPGELTLYVNMRDPRVMPELVQALKLRADPDGPIEIVDMFWNSLALQSFPCAPDPLIYADLISSSNSRNLEIAQQLRKVICERVQSQS
ncbi:type IV toxin-antitoxin system AbiEi family antitoxin [Massilia niastensis]|uniref:type IV toxin-antitoxin system AbiEi family antitoxin n=1 Tax=Massilia niastensis TaxID=544911 RepID=UPI0003669905|nr:type IV toxin-antitoxin system AbiEi family antitoxin [Massilia niastensis]